MYFLFFVLLFSLCLPLLLIPMHTFQATYRIYMCNTQWSSK